MRENQKNYFLGRVSQITGDAPSTEDGAWGNQKLSRQGHLKGEIDYENMKEFIHGPLIDTFLELPERIQNEIADQALHQSAASSDVFKSEQLSIKEIRILLTIVRQQAQRL